MLMQVADPDIKKAGFVTKWLGYGAQMLGPVKKKDGTTVDREIQTWLPKKKVKAHSLRYEASPFTSCTDTPSLSVRRSYRPKYVLQTRIVRIYPSGGVSNMRPVLAVNSSADPALPLRCL